MEELLSYWPLIFLLLAVYGRLKKYLNEKNNKMSKQEKTQQDNLKEVTQKSENQEVTQQTEEQVEYDTFSFDRDDETEVITDEKTDEFQEIKKEQKETEQDIKKPQVRKLKSGKKINLFENKEDLIRGVIMKEVLDEPRYKKKIHKKL